MMMKTIIFLFCVLFAVSTVLAQTKCVPATAEQQKVIIKGITETSEQLKTLSCDFVQYKTISILSETMISEGHLSFRQNDKLRWEYTKPYAYEFVMNGDKIMINSGVSKNVVDVKSNKIFSEISKIIISGINGSGIFDRTKFSVQLMNCINGYTVILEPKQKELKQLFHKISISFNVVDYTVNWVGIEETGGDTTLIEMKSKQINKELNDEIFIIH